MGISLLKIAKPSPSKLNIKMPTISLRSSDGELFPVDLEVAKKSMTIRTMLDTLDIGEDDDEEVPILNVNAAILKLVIQWATYHKDDPQPNDDENTKTAENINISDWDA